MMSQAGPISGRDSLPVQNEIETIMMIDKKNISKTAQEVRSANPMGRKTNY